MYRLLAPSALLLAASLPATAADLPSRKAPPAPAPLPIEAMAPFSWAGAYAGTQISYGWSRDRWTGTGARYRLKSDGVFGGLHVGYNWMTGSYLLGLEADADYGRARATATLLQPPASNEISSSLGLRASARLRAGYAFDRVLIYGTGGVAAANVKRTLTQYTGGVFNAAYSDRETRFGWTAGAGVGLALNSNWSARLEYRYTDLGSSDWSAIGTKHRLNEHSARLGLSYHFSDRLQPVYARY